MCCARPDRILRRRSETRNLDQMAPAAAVRRFPSCAGCYDHHDWLHVSSAMPQCLLSRVTVVMNSVEFISVGRDRWWRQWLGGGGCTTRNRTMVRYSGHKSTRHTSVLSECNPNTRGQEMMWVRQCFFINIFHMGSKF